MWKISIFHFVNLKTIIMEEEISSGGIGRKYGLIFGLISGLIFVATSAGRIDLSFAGILVTWGVVIGVFVFAVKEYRTANGGFISFGKGFGINMWVALIGGIVRSVIQYVYTIVDPEYLDYAKELRENSPFGGPPQDSNAEIPDWVEFFNTGEFIAIASFISAIFAGLIFGAIVSAIMKNEAEDF